MGRATDGPVWRWRNLANIPAPAVTGPMLHGLNLGLVAVWIHELLTPVFSYEIALS